MYTFWGKGTKQQPSCHLLVYHCLDVAAVLREFLARQALLRGRIHGLAPMDPAQLDSILLFFAALHDLGKFAPTFQNKRPDLVELLGGDPRLPCSDGHHTVFGLHLFEAIPLPETFGEHAGCISEELLDVLAPLTSAAFGHHGKPCPRGNGLILPARTKEISAEFVQEISPLLLGSELKLPGGDEDFFKPVSWLFAGLLVLCDWIASGEYFAPRAEPMPLPTYWDAYALPAAREAVQLCGVLCPQPRRTSGFHDLLPNLPADAGPTPLQSLALAEIDRENGQRLLIFEDVTGAGKTEASLLAAHALMARGEAEGLYVALPTMATANGMYARLADGYRALFEDSPGALPSLMLAHGARGIHAEYLGGIGLESGRQSDSDGETSDSGAFCSAWLADNRKKALLAPCGAGTLDQALLAVLPSRHQCLRLLGLGRNVLVADEVHAYDPYTTKILETLLTFHAGLGGSAILLSATLPVAVKQGLAKAFCLGAGHEEPALWGKPLPLATRLDAKGAEEIALPETRRIEVAVELNADVDRALSRIISVRMAGGCSIFIHNTVDRAVATYNALATSVPPDDLILFHARLALCDRQDIEARVISIFGRKSTREDRQGKILVATQVVEQSLDLDADFLVSELAPMELLIQRAGRCQRHKRDWRPEGFSRPSMLVISPQALADAGQDWGKAEMGHGLYVYPMPGVLWRTVRLLAEAGKMVLPQDARRLVEGAYDQNDPQTPAALAEKDYLVWGDQRGMVAVARQNVLDFSQGYGCGAAMNSWQDDRVTPTRLGEPSEILRLLRWQDGSLGLWAGQGLSARLCALSEVSVAARRLKGLELGGEWKDRLEKLGTTMPDQGRWARLVPLVQNPEKGGWRCALPGWEHIAYSAVIGLRFANNYS